LVTKSKANCAHNNKMLAKIHYQVSWDFNRR